MKTMDNLMGFCLILLVCIPINSQAQSVKRQCVSSYGATIASNNIICMQTVGQPFNTIASFKNKTPILPGFQQPVVFKVETINSSLLKTLNLNIYPNPASYSVTIQSGKLIENSIICVTDITGKVIMSDSAIQFHTYSINCEAWANGIYIITVSDKNQNISSIKLTINK